MYHQDSKLVVWNPVSGETKWIHQPRKSFDKYDVFALGYDSKSSCYKIIRMDQIFRGVVVQIDYETYDLISNSWSDICVKTDRFYLPWDWRSGVSVKGHTYWLAMINMRHLRFY
ncbi:unnamed protein product [Microthlaspi erraticum]|uniref:F-box associated beta-propeller type 1 domain-containing protein n=1 Tax=Microthlaspi erraticum TaxID=1685480 RepID=A0A6D2KIG2_9BRAS|nr:unnamed protein product [Microthlaspi erraticum]